MNPQTSPKPDKYCSSCGQKNFRPNRSLKELFVEFVEDWLGYDSKIYKTAAALVKPGKLTLDYFANSHHKNHYITPIRLYLLLSVIYFVMTQFGGLNLNDIEFDNNVTQEQQQISEEAKKHIQEALNQPGLSEQDKKQIQRSIDLLEQNISANDEPRTTNNPSTTDESAASKKNRNDSDGLNINISGQDKEFSSKEGCLRDPKDLVTLWPQWLEEKVESQVSNLCQDYDNILLLPEDRQKDAKVQFGLGIAQNAIEIVPQTIFFALPLLALILGLFYFWKKRLYVEHLVLLMHSHSLLFSAILLYLLWYQLTELVPVLGYFPMGILLCVYLVVYLFMSHKRYYGHGFFNTLWRFILFGFLYLLVITLLLFIIFFISLMIS